MLVPVSIDVARAQASLVVRFVVALFWRLVPQSTEHWSPAAACWCPVAEQCHTVYTVHTGSVIKYDCNTPKTLLWVTVCGRVRARRGPQGFHTREVQHQRNAEIHPEAILIIFKICCSIRAYWVLIGCTSVGSPTRGSGDLC